GGAFAAAARRRTGARSARTAAGRLSRGDRSARDRRHVVQGNRGSRGSTDRDGDVTSGAGAGSSGRGAHPRCAGGAIAMTCDELERDLDPYVDRELSAESDAAVREHLGTCAACRQRVADREALGRMVRSVPYYEAPDRLRARLVGEAQRSRSTRRLFTW